jgi:TonB family protein
MKNLKPLFVLLGLMTFASLETVAGDVKVIANPGIQADAMSLADLRGVFLEEKNSLAGMHVEPILEKSGPVHEAFLKEYLEKNADSLRTYYRTLVFTGKGSMPKTVGSDAEVIAYVARTKGAIGYVSATSSADGVKTLFITSEASRIERALLARVEPAYPETLQRLHIGGTVRLKLTISPKGSIEEVELLGGNPILGESAITAVKQWVYAPSHSRTTAQVSIPFDPER